MENFGWSQRYYHWQGFHRAVLSLSGAARPEERTLFEQSFQKALDLATGTRPVINLVAQMTPFTHFYYAAFLDEMFGNGRLADVRSHAKAVVDLVEADDPARNEFLMFLRVERDRATERRDHNYRFFTELAGPSAEFAAFLVRNGWHLK